MTKKSEKYHLQFIKLLDDMKAVNNNQRRQNKFLFSLGLREGLKKRGEGSATGDFPLRKKKNNMVLKHWILPSNQFKTHFFFSIFWWGDPFQLRSWSEGQLKLKSSLEKASDKCQKTHIIQNLFRGA